jgi:hypothetical protein
MDSSLQGVYSYRVSMMRFHRLILWAILAGILVCESANRVRAGEQVPTDVQIKEAIANLGSEEFKKREEASALLLAAGARAVTGLWPALASEDAEVKMRATAIIAKLGAVKDAKSAEEARKFCEETIKEHPDLAAVLSEPLLLPGIISRKPGNLEIKVTPASNAALPGGEVSLDATLTSSSKDGFWVRRIEHEATVSVDVRHSSAIWRTVVWKDEIPTVWINLEGAYGVGGSFSASSSEVQEDLGRFRFVSESSPYPLGLQKAKVPDGLGSTTFRLDYRWSDFTKRFIQVGGTKIPIRAYISASSASSASGMATVFVVPEPKFKDSGDAKDGLTATLAPGWEKDAPPITGKSFKVKLTIANSGEQTRRIWPIRSGVDLPVWYCLRDEKGEVVHFEYVGQQTWGDSRDALSGADPANPLPPGAAAPLALAKGASESCVIDIPAPKSAGEHTLVFGFGRFTDETKALDFFTGELISNAIKVPVGDNKAAAPPAPPKAP